MTVRHGLARATYLRCVPRPAQTDLKRAGRSAAASSGQSVPARTRRAVLALVLVGDHTYVDAADLLGLPRLTVTDLLVSFLRDGDLGAEVQRSSTGPSRRQHARASNVRTHDESD